MIDNRRIEIITFAFIFIFTGSGSRTRSNVSELSRKRSQTIENRINEGNLSEAGKLVQCLFVSLVVLVYLSPCVVISEAKQLLESVPAADSQLKPLSSLKCC